MGNPLRGEVTFTLGDAEHKMRLSASRIAEIEGALKRPFGAIVGEMAAGSIECTAVVSAKAMGLPVNAVYTLIDDYTLEPFALAAVEAINLCGVFPKVSGEPANPPKATA